MLVLHACWSAAGASLWAEDSEPAVTSPSEALRRARPHPFAVPAPVLGGLVGGSPCAHTLALPSLRRSPLDSPELVRPAPRPAGRSGPFLLPWTVPVVQISPGMLRATLADIIRPDRSDPDANHRDIDMRPAAATHFLSELADYAEDLVERARVVPTIERSEVGQHARWRVVLTGADALAAQTLIAQMPPAFRAAAPDEPPARLVTDALDLVADALVRERLPESLLPPRRGRRPARLPAAEAWITALTGAEARIDADDESLDLLAEQLRPWTEAIREDPGPAGLVLRLSDPGSPDPLAADDQDRPAERSADGPWRVDFLLRSRADPSLLVDADRVWSDDGALARWLERPREVLLTELARAQRIYPAIEHGLRSAQPTSLLLDSTGAHDFLSGSAAALQDGGFEVLLPAWWSRRRRLGLRASATPSDRDAGSDFGRDQLCDFRWEIAVGEHGLSEEEIAALTAAKAPLVQLRGEWIAVDQTQLARGLEFLRRDGTGRKSAGEILALALSHPDDLDLPLELVDVSAEGWLGDVLDGTILGGSKHIQAVEPPDTFTATLRPYQSRGLDWLHFLGRLGLGACLADDMGLGKTVQLLALEASARNREVSRQAPTAYPGPTLLLCPMSLIANWESEAARFAPELRILAHHGADRRHGEDLTAALGDTDIVVTTYATALNDIDELSQIAWERVVLDEAQAIKNRLSRTAKAVRRLQADHRVALTGTPVENRLGELWSIMDFLNPGMLATPELFKARYATPIERHGDQSAADRLRRITRPYLLRRVKTDPTIIDDLPEKIEITQHYRLTVEQASLYQSVVDDMMERIEDSEGIQRRGNVLAAMMKLKQVCNHPAQLLHDRSTIGRRSGKVIRLEEILEEILAEGDRVLCFTQFTEFADLIIPHLAARFDTDVAYLSGSTPRARRTELVERFQAGEGPPIFVLSLKAGGTGLNLTAANHVLHVDRWWNPAVENQATDRAFRIGQKQRVQVRKFVATGTIEERIDAMIKEKQTLANLVVGDGETWLSELSTDRLRELFALSEEAVGE